MNKRYIMNDARRRRKLFKYVQIIIKAVKITRMSIFNQLTLIFNESNVKFQRDVSKFNDELNLNSFLQIMKNKKKI